MDADTPEDLHFEDPSIRQIEESDIPELIQLFELNYNCDYIDPDVYDGSWFKRCIYNDNRICLAVAEQGKILASGAVILDFGDYNDQIGEIARLVVHPEYTGHGLGRRIVNALLQAADNTVEFAIGYTRTANSFSQKMLERADLTAIGFLPQYYTVKKCRESIVLYGKLLGTGRLLRTKKLPVVTPEIAPLADYVLTQMGLPNELIIDDQPAYPNQADVTLEPINRCSMESLVKIEQGRLIDPLLFGSLSLEQGFSFVRRHKAVYLMAVDAVQHPVGAIGYQVDQSSQIVKGIELVAEAEAVRGLLCRSFVEVAEQVLDAKVIEVNVSAYDAQLQRTFFDYGFRPVAYAPAMVFHGTHRLDVVKMMKLNVPNNPDQLDGMRLTDIARSMVLQVKNAQQLSSQ